MSYINTVTIIGNLTDSPKVFKDNKALSFSIACNSKYKDKEGTLVEEVDYFDCVSFRNVETLKQYLKKGNRVCVSGSLKQKRFREGGKTSIQSSDTDKGANVSNPKREGRTTRQHHGGSSRYPRHGHGI